VGALAPHGQAAAVADALVRADLHLALDVLLDVAAEVASTLTLSSIHERSRVISSSVRSRTRVLSSIPVAAHTLPAVVRPTPKMYVREMTSRFSRGMSTPAMRAMA